MSVKSDASAKKAAPKKSKKVVSSSSDDSDSDSSSEEKVKKPVLAKRARAASNASAKSDASSKKKAAKAPKKKVESSSDSDSDSSSEDEKPKKAAKKVVVSDSDSDSSEEEVKQEEAPKEEAAAVDVEGVENPEGKTELFVKSLSFNVDEAWLGEHFGKHGTLTKVKLIMSQGQSKGIAFVEYETPEQASKAVAAENGAEIDGRVIAVEFSGSKPGAGGPTSGAPGESNTVFCGNLGFRTTENAIWEFFGNEVSTVRVAMNEEGRPRGFCHVEFNTPAAASEAMNLNGQELDGRAVRLDLS